MSLKSEIFVLWSWTYIYVEYNISVIVYVANVEEKVVLLTLYTSI